MVIFGNDLPTEAVDFLNEFSRVKIRAVPERRVAGRPTGRREEQDTWRKGAFCGFRDVRQQISNETLPFR